MRNPIPVSSSATGRWFMLLTATTTIVSASPFPRNAFMEYGFSPLLPRDGCATYCGSDKQFCCASNQVCTTLASNVATCAPAGGSYALYTTTWTETRTYTSTFMTTWAPAPTPIPGVDCRPQSPEQEACGSICCAGWQTCAFKGQCSSRPGYQEPSPVVSTSNGVVTTRYFAPYRVTGVTTIVSSGARSGPSSYFTATATTTSASSTSTSDGDTIGADGSNKGGTGGGLSGGAIAGIVIGTLAGVALLMLLCFCCIARGIWNAIFGRKTERSEKVVYEEDVRYSSRHGSRPPSTYARRDRHSGWFGGRPTSVADRRGRKSDGKWWLGLAGAAATLLALLNFRKDKKPVRRPQSSRYTDSSYMYSDVTDMSTTQVQGDEPIVPAKQAAVTAVTAVQRLTIPVARADHRVVVRLKIMPCTNPRTFRIL
ncbi:hypothetical protein ED733_005761 [Metarhizium rileyi]|uniref:Glycophorin A domain protein n=1 Tax=Metarhizium rileyi (strain RCEF 4871) TaxID=1649241 RepID=A0A5C6GJ61_METRR|nr:hypothetical protein ED733_005761 [Metarhizium rileyi]